MARLFMTCQAVVAFSKSCSPSICLTVATSRQARGDTVAKSFVISVRSNSLFCGRLLFRGRGFSVGTLQEEKSEE